MGRRSSLAAMTALTPWEKAVNQPPGFVGRLLPLRFRNPANVEGAGNDIQIQPIGAEDFGEAAPLPCAVGSRAGRGDPAPSRSRSRKNRSSSVSAETCGIPQRLRSILTTPLTAAR